jgi:UDPglucose--hexose-1-phosphate uridylyltransferase
MRARGVQNPKYTEPFVFTNDYPALLSDDTSVTPTIAKDDLFRRESVRGTCRVVCFSPRHDLT